MFKKLLCYSIIVLMLIVFGACIGILITPPKIVEIEKPQKTKTVYIENEADTTLKKEIDTMSATLKRYTIQIESNKTDKAYAEECAVKIEQLLTLAKDEGATIYYVPRSFMEDLQAQYDMSFVAGGVNWQDAIYISIEWVNYPPVLAHELAHFIAGKYNGDWTEETANIIGQQLLETGHYDLSVLE